MTNKVITPENLKYEALELAIKSNCGTEYNEINMMLTNPDKIIEAAKKFEDYLKDVNND